MQVFTGLTHVKAGWVPGFDIFCQSGGQPADRHLHYNHTLVFILHSD